MALRPWDDERAPHFPNAVAHRVYHSRMSRDLFETATVRFGVETPPNLPLVRLTAGLGVLWGRPTMPVGVIGLAMSTRGPHKRFLVEAERLQMRVHADERHNGTGAGGTSYSKALRFNPSTFTVRLGMEWTFGAARDGPRSP
jgi:hypothetical protein